MEDLCPHFSEMEILLTGDRGLDNTRVIRISDVSLEPTFVHLLFGWRRRLFCLEERVENMVTKEAVCENQVELVFAQQAISYVRRTNTNWTSSWKKLSFCDLALEHPRCFDDFETGCEQPRVRVQSVVVPPCQFHTDQILLQ